MMVIGLVTPIRLGMVPRVYWTISLGFSGTRVILTHRHHATLQAQQIISDVQVEVDGQGQTCKTNTEGRRNEKMQ